MRVRAYMVTEYDIPAVWEGTDAEIIAQEEEALLANPKFIGDFVVQYGLSFFKVAPVEDTRPISGQLALNFDL